jgi:hypothetical protein
MTMLATEIDDTLYTDAKARRALASAIKVYRAKADILSDLVEAVKKAEARLAAMKTEIDQSAGVETEVAEAAATALCHGGNVSDRSKAWRAKEERDALIADHELLSTGLLRLQARALAAEREANAELIELHRVREAIIQAELNKLAAEVARVENEAAALRWRLRGFSICGNVSPGGNGVVPQKLSNFARSLLIDPPKNAVPPQINSLRQKVVDSDKAAFIAWKKALESDANAVLVL